MQATTFIVNRWENHKFMKDLQRSQVIKGFIFDFIITYTSIVYYAFINKDYLLLVKVYIV